MIQPMGHCSCVLFRRTLTSHSRRIHSVIFRMRSTRPLELRGSESECVDVRRKLEPCACVYVHARAGNIPFLSYSSACDCVLAMQVRGRPQQLDSSRQS